MSWASVSGTSTPLSHTSVNQYDTRIQCLEIQKSQSEMQDTLSTICIKFSNVAAKVSKLADDGESAAKHMDVKQRIPREISVS